MLHLLLAADNVFTLSDRTEARLRAPDPITNATALDLDTLLDARAVWSTHSTTYTLADMPRFILLDYNDVARQGALADSVLASAEWHSLRARIRVAEIGTYGQQSFESLSALPAPGTSQAAPPSGQPVPVPTATLVPPTSQSLLIASSETSVATTLELRPWRLFANVAYQFSGGADAAAQKVLPFQQGPVARAIADFSVDGRQRDHLLTTVTASEASFSLPAGTEDVLAGIEEQWRHQLGRRSETLLGAGWNVLRSRSGPDAPDVSGSSPVAGAAFNQRVVHGRDSGEVRFDVRLAPLINPLTGLVDEQVRGSVLGRWSRRNLTLRVFASAGESVDQDTPTSVRLATAELAATSVVSKWHTFDGGVRGLYQAQKQAPNGEQTISQAVVFFAVSVRAVKVRF